MATRMVRRLRGERRPAYPLMHPRSTEAPARRTPRRVARMRPRNRDSGARRSRQPEPGAPWSPAGGWNGADDEPPGRLELAPHTSGLPVWVVTKVPPLAPGNPLVDPGG